MKYFLTGLMCLTCLIFCQNLVGQQFTAKYKVVREVIAMQDNQSHTVASLKLEGYYYMKGSKIISFLKPLYLGDYPNGFIEERENELDIHNYGINMDSLQNLMYYNLDSMIARNRMEISGLNMKGYNYASYFKMGVNKWKVLPETKTIHGLACQHAVLQKKNGDIYCDVWFASNLPMQIGFYGLVDVPGLMVEGEMSTSHEKFILDSYTFDESIPDSIFWPKEFYESFTLQGKLKSEKERR